MKMPNDKKRPNTNSDKETRERKGNQKYIWVSKRILEVPVMNPDGSLTNIKQMVAERYGRTFKREVPKQLSKRDFGRKYGWDVWWDLRPIGVGE